MSASADQAEGPVVAVAMDSAADPMPGQGSLPGKDVQQQSPPAPGIVYPAERKLYTQDIQSLESPGALENADYFRRILIQTITVAFIWALGVTLLLALGAILFFAFHFSSFAIGGALTAAWSMVMASVFWLRKLRCRIAGQNVLLGDRADVAPLSFSHIVWAFNRGGVPVDFCRVRRFSAAGLELHEVLEVRSGMLYGFVSCFASGADLYIGWTYWLCLSPARWLTLWARRFLWGGRLPYHAVKAGRHADVAEAFRAALQRAVQEGVEVATGQLAAQGDGTIGTLVPVAERERGWSRMRRS